MRVFQKAVWGIALVFCLLLPSTGLAGSHGSRKQDNFDSALVERLSSEDAQPVIVRAKPGHKSSVRNKVAAHTARYREHTLIDAFSAHLTPRQIRELASDSDVDGVSYDAEIAGFATTSTGTVDTASLVKQIVGVGDWFTGSTMAVAVIDSGIAPISDFDTRILGMYNFINGAPGVPTAPFDDYGHGTHVAGLIGSNGSSSSGKYAGVAPGVKFVALKVLDRKGAGRTSDVINALGFVVANRSALGIKVVNLSLGHPVYESAKTDPLVIAVENAVRSGLVVVVAAGNYGTNPQTGLSGYAGIASPGNAPSAITVGAVNTNGTVDRSDDRVAPYSSSGPSWFDGLAKPDVLAPGQALVSNDAAGSTLETTYPSLVIRSGNSKYLKLSGSSMATAVVSGMVVMALEANVAGAQKRWQDYQTTLKRTERTAFVAPPPLTSNAIKAMLQFTATPIHDEYGVSYGPLQQGTGMVNGLGLIYFAYYSDTTKSPGEYWMTLTGYPYSSTYGATSMTWSQSIIWGTSILAGTSVADVNQYGWALNVVWGTGEEGNVVWGTVDDEGNVVWGTTVPITLDLTWSGNATWANNVVWGTAAEDWDGNVVWGTNLVGYFNGFNVVWGTNDGDEGNVVWGTAEDGDVVWGTSNAKVTALGLAVGGAL